MRPVRGGKTTPCHCVYRAVFRACHTRFRTIALSGAYASSVKPEHGFLPGRNRRGYGMKWQEYAADFVLIARRYLTGNALYIFRMHFLLGCEWAPIAAKLGMDKGEFFHEVYRIQQRLGRLYYEIQPHSLFPLDQYFASTQRGNGGDEAFKDDPYCIDEEEGPLDGDAIHAIDTLPDFPKRASRERKKVRTALRPPLARAARASGD